MKKLTFFLLLLLLSASSALAQDRITRGGGTVLVNEDGSVTVTLAPGKTFRLRPQATLPATCADGQFAFLANVGLKECVSGVWHTPGGDDDGGEPGVSTFNTRNGDVALNSADVVDALGYIPEDAENKNQANGYAGLAGGKIAGAQVSEVLSLTGLNDVAISTPASSQYLRHDGDGWVNDNIQANDLPAGIDPLKIGTGSVNATKFNYLAGVTSDIQTQLNTKQAASPDLTAIAALLSTNDDVLQYKAGAWTSRTPAQLKSDLALNLVDNTSDATKNSAAAALTNKSINADDNTISNIGSSEISPDLITGQPVETSADNADALLIYDNSAAALKKMTRADFIVGISGAGDVTSGTGTSVEDEIALFSGTSGKVIKRATTTGILKGTAGVLSAAVAGTDYAPATSGTSILKGSGSGGFSSAVSGTDYAPATSGTSLLKGNGSGGFSNAAAGTDYESPLTFSSPLSRATNTISCPTCGVTGSGLNQFASTTSAQLFGVISNETGTGLLMGNDTPTIITPTIASFANANHNHTNSAGGGQLTEAALSSAITTAKGGTGLTATPTNGQIPVGNGSGYTLATLTAGGGVSITNASGSITITVSQPHATVLHNANQSLTSGSWATLSFNTEDNDATGMHDTATNNSRITIATAGDYEGICNVSFSANTTGSRGVRIIKNGDTTTPLATLQTNTVTEAGFGAVVSLKMPSRALVVSDYLECQAWQTSGATINAITVTGSNPQFGIKRN